MSESFKKIRKKAMLSAILKSAIVGVFCALLAVGLTLLIVKANAARKEWYIYLLAGVCAAGAGFGITFLFTVPSDKKLAKRLDFEYGLNEKVQTMVEFGGQSGTILGLQRKDADEKLKNLPRRKLSFKKIWQYIAVSVAGAAVFAAGGIYPSKYTPSIPADGFEIDEWQSVALEQLCEEVKTSSLTEEVKTPVSEALDSLLADLKTETSGAAMRSKVANAVEITDNAVIGISSYRDIATAMHAAEVREALNTLKTSLVKAAESFGARKSVLSMQTVTSAAEQSEEKIGAALEVFTAELQKSTDECTDKKKLADIVAAFRGSLNLGLDDENLYEKLKNDALYLSMSDYSKNLGEKIVDGYRGESLASLKQYVKDFNENFIASAQSPLSTQSYANAMDSYIRNRLAEIFKIQLPEFEELAFIDGSDDSGDDSGKDNAGGAGDDENVGGEEIVFDPSNEEYVKFIDLWLSSGSQYSSKLAEYIDSIEDEELKEYLQKYFGEITKKDESASADN